MSRRHRRDRRQSEPEPISSDAKALLIAISFPAVPVLVWCIYAAFFFKL